MTASRARLEKPVSKSKPQHVAGSFTGPLAGPSAAASATEEDGAERLPWLIPGGWTSVAGPLPVALKAALRLLSQACCQAQGGMVLDVWGQGPPAWLRRPYGRRRWPGLWWLCGRGPVHALALLTAWAQLPWARVGVVVAADALPLDHDLRGAPWLLRQCRRRGLALVGLTGPPAGPKGGPTQVSPFAAWASRRARTCASVQQDLPSQGSTTSSRPKNGFPQQRRSWLHDRP